MILLSENPKRAELQVGLDPGARTLSAPGGGRGGGVVSLTSSALAPFIGSLDSLFVVARWLPAAPDIYLSSPELQWKDSLFYTKTYYGIRLALSGSYTPPLSQSQWPVECDVPSCGSLGHLSLQP